MIRAQFDQSRLTEIGEQLKAEKERAMGNASRSVSA